MPTPKDPLSEMAIYRQAATHATLCTADDRGFCWYLALDEVTNFYHQTKFFKPQKTFSIHDVVPLARIHQALEMLSCSQKKNRNQVQTETSFSWMFSNNQRICEPLDHYRYWIARSLEITSPHLAEEKKTILQLLSNASGEKNSDTEILPYLKIVQQCEQGAEKKDALSTSILLHRCKTLAFTAFYLLLLKHQQIEIKKEGKKKLLLFFNKMAHCLEQELGLRKRILEATEQGKEDQVRYLTLIATSWSSVKDSYQKAAEELSKNPKNSLSWYHIARYGEKTAAISQRLMEIILTTSNKEAAGYLEHALFLLKNAFEFRVQTTGTSLFLNQEFGLWLAQAAAITKRSSCLWRGAAFITIAFPSCSFLKRLWKSIALYIEYQGHNKIQQIVTRNNIQQAQHTLKEVLHEKKEYRKKIIQAFLTKQQELAEQWRLTAEEATFFSTISSRSATNPSAEKAWKEFLQQFSSKKTFLLFLYQTSTSKTRSLSLQKAALEEAVANYRYWIVRTTAKKNRNFFAEKNWFENLPLWHHAYKANCAKERLETWKLEGAQNTSHQTPLQMMVHCAEQAFTFRTKALQAIKQAQEWEARQWTLAAYTIEQTAEGHLQFLNTPWWKELSAISEKAITYRMEAIKMKLVGHSRRASFFERAAFLLEDRFDHELELRISTETNPESLISWKEIFDQTEEIAVLWVTYATKLSWRKRFLLKQTLREKEKKRLQKIKSILLQQISFCLPPESFPDATTQEAWKEGKLVPRLEFSVPYAWIYQTWKFLHDAGIKYSLSTQPLEPGIVIGWGCYLMNRIGTKEPFPTDTFLVDIIGDQLPHPNSHLYLSQNPIYAKHVPHSLFMPHWPQRNLIPRDPHRGDRFENVAFFGDPSNCVEELKSETWREQVAKEFGINFFLQGNMGWHDYSAIDAVVAIRSFSKRGYFYKPATKLCNAWLAGVPFIGNPESAYAEAGTPGKDYLVATSMEELLQQLKLLKENPSLRHQLVEHGRIQVKAFTREATLERWKELLQTTIPAYAARWQKKSALERCWFFFINRLIYFFNIYLQS